MNPSEQIEKLRDYPTNASESFRQQLDRVRVSLQQMDKQENLVRGIDRSSELTPVARPTILRTAHE